MMISIIFHSFAKQLLYDIGTLISKNKMYLSLKYICIFSKKKNFNGHFHNSWFEGSMPPTTIVFFHGHIWNDFQMQASSSLKSLNEKSEISSMEID